MDCGQFLSCPPDLESLQRLGELYGYLLDNTIDVTGDNEDVRL